MSSDEPKQQSTEPSTGDTLYDLDTVNMSERGEGPNHSYESFKDEARQNPAMEDSLVIRYMDAEDYDGDLLAESNLATQSIDDFDNSVYDEVEPSDLLERFDSPSELNDEYGYLALTQEVLENNNEQEVESLLQKFDGEVTVLGEDPSYEALRGVDRYINRDITAEEAVDVLSGQPGSQYEPVDMVDEYLDFVVDLYSDLDDSATIKNCAKSMREVRALNGSLDYLSQEGELEDAERVSEIAYLLQDNLAQRQQMLLDHFDEDADIVKERFSRFQKGIKTEIDEVSDLDGRPKPHTISDNDDVYGEVLSNESVVVEPPEWERAELIEEAGELNNF